jgi:WD40 repeat protein
METVRRGTLILATTAICFLSLIDTRSVSAANPERHPPRAEMVVQVGHSGLDVTSVAFSPDGKFLASGGDDASAIVWNLSNHRMVHKFRGHRGSVTTAAFAGDSIHLLTAAPYDSAIVWNAVTGEKLKVLDSSKDCQGIGAISRDGTRIATDSGNDINLWNATDSTRIGTLAGHTAAIHALAFSPDGKLLASASDDHSAILWDVHERKLVRKLSAHKSEVQAVSFSADGKQLATAGRDSHAIIWNVADGKIVHNVDTRTDKESEGGPDLQFVTFLNDSRKLGLGTWGIFFRWDIAADEQSAFWPPNGLFHTDVPPYNVGAHPIAISADEKLIAAGVPGGPEMEGHETITIIDQRTFHELWRSTGQGDYVRSLEISRDGKKLYMGSPGAYAMVWGIDGPSIRDENYSQQEWPGGMLALSQDGTRLCSTSWSSVHIWDTRSLHEIREFTAAYGNFSQIAIHPNGKSLAVDGTGGDVLVYDFNTGRQIQKQDNRHTPPFQPKLGFGFDYMENCRIAYSLDGKFIAATNANRVTLREADTGKLIRNIDDDKRWFESLAYSLDGKQIATGTTAGEEVLIWDAATGKKLHTLHVGQNPEARTLAVRYSPDGSAIVGAGDTGIAVAWDARTGKELRRFDVHSRVATLRFTPNGKFLVIACVDGDVGLWDFVSGQLRLTLQNANSGEDWIAYTPDWHFDGSKEGRALLTFSLADGETVVPARDVEKQLRQRGLFKQVFGAK